MGIEGIDILKGDNMNEENGQAQQSTSSEADASPTETAQEVTPPTPAYEEAAKAAGRDVDDDDLAPDADEAGDEELDPELQQHAQDRPDQPDTPDQEG